MPKPPNDAFMGMLDLAWSDFRTYRDGDSKPIGMAVILIGQDRDGNMTIQTGANTHPHNVEMAITQLFLGMATGTLAMEQVRGIRKKRVV